MTAFNELKKVSILTILALMLLGSGSIFCAQPEETEPKRVLVIYSYHEGLLWERLIDDSFRATLAANFTEPIDVNIEHTDRVSYPENEYLLKLVDLYERKYSDPKMDLVIGIDDEATEILLKYGEELFSGVPMVFVTAERKDLQRDSLKPNMTSLVWELDIEGTVELIQKILPETKHLFIISGSSPSDQAVNGLTRKVLGGHTNRLDVNYLTGLTIEDLLQRVSQLPENSAVIYLVFSQDPGGKSLVPRDILSVISEKANAPMFGIVGTYRGQGIVGGKLLSPEVQGKRCAEIGLRILRGESPMDIIPQKTFNVSMFDWRQLKRWSIAEDRLPPGSIVEFKELTFWEEHRGRIISTILLIFLQFMLITALLFNILRRNRAEKERDEQLRFEGFISRLSSEFINHSAESIDLKIADALSRIGTFLAVDRAFLFRFNWDKTEFRISHLWEAEEIPKDQVVRGVIVKEFFPWLSGNLLEGKDIVVSDVENLSFEETAQKEYAYCRQMGIRSFLILPIKTEKAPLCAVGLDSIGVKKNWSKNVINRLRFVGEICANSIERQHSEEKLKASELKYRTVADFTYDWEYWAYLDGTMTYVSSSCERISGYPARDFLNNPSLFREIIVPEDREIWDTHSCDSRNKFKGKEIQFRIHKRDGEIRWIEHACQPVSDDQGNPSGFRASNRDITKRKHYETETLRLQSELAHVDRVSTIGTLTSALAHEINQPLTAMRSYAQAALRFLDADQPDYDNLRKALKGIVADNKRASSVINHLRSLVKKEKHSAEAFDINSMIERVISLVKSETVLRNTKVKLNLHQNVSASHGNSVQIQQVIINLLTNALDAIENQPVESRHITLSTKAEKAGVVIVSISDSGGGINPDKMEEIFNPFYTTKPQGLGLGLAICRSIIEAHGGQLRCENNPDGGATFSFTLPTNSKSQNKNSK